MAQEGGKINIALNAEYKFYYPYILYNYGQSEIWLQKVDVPKFIHRFIFINPITAFDYADSVCDGNTMYPKDNRVAKKKDLKAIGMLLTYHRHHKIAYFSYKNGKALLERLHKPISVDEFNTSIVAFTQIDAVNNKKRLEPCVIFHTPTQLLFYYLSGGTIKARKDKSLEKNNVIHFINRIYIWENNGRYIEKIDTSISADDTKLLTKVYEAKNEMFVSIHIL